MDDRIQPTQLTATQSHRPRLKTIISWCFFDWANSSFFAVVTTFIFAAYFTSKVAPNKILGTYWWGNAIAIAALAVAIISPIVGAIADYGGKRKYWLFFLTYCGIIASTLLWFAYPNSAYAFITLFFVIIATISFETGQTFYNALLPSVAPKGYLGRISGWGWATGYVGGLSCLIIALYLFVKGHVPWLDATRYENVRICGPLIGVWVLIFSLPLFLFVADFPSKNYSLSKAINAGMKELRHTLAQLPKEKNILVFLISRVFYIDGLNTLFAFGGIYAAGTFHMSMADIALFGIILNVTAGIGAALFAWVDDWIGAKKTVAICLVMLTIFGSSILLIHSIELFWLIAPAIGIFVGPAQAASRSLMVRIAPAKKITEMFGLFALSGKATAFLGPWLVAEVTEYFSSQRMGMTVISGFFIVGLIVLSFVREYY